MSPSQAARRVLDPVFHRPPGYGGPTEPSDEAHEPKERTITDGTATFTGGAGPARGTICRVGSATGCSAQCIPRSLDKPAT